MNDEQKDESSIKSLSVVPKKRGRGRPRKEKTVKSEIPKNKRGRPLSDDAHHRDFKLQLFLVEAPDDMSRTEKMKIFNEKYFPITNGNEEGKKAYMSDDILKRAITEKNNAIKNKDIAEAKRVKDFNFVRDVLKKTTSV